jgi:hypothetical protein
MSNKCSICGEYAWGDRHTCPPKWYCVYADEYETIPNADCMIEEGHKIYALDKEHAVIKFAERYQADSAWYPHEMSVLIMDKDEKYICKYVVNQEAMPSYWIEYSYSPECYDVVHPVEEDE